MARDEVLDDRTRLKQHNVTVFQHWHPAQGVARAVLIRLQRLGVELHTVEFVRQF